MLVRRHFRARRKFDAVVGVILLEPDEEQELLQYIRTYKPLVIVVAPRCTASGGWASTNSIN